MLPILSDLLEALQSHFKEAILEINSYNQEITVEIKSSHLQSMALDLRDKQPFLFTTLIDICGVDYKEYGIGEWVTSSATHTGFDRGVNTHKQNTSSWHKPRFAAIYHLLSTQHNHRLRLRVFAEATTGISDDQLLVTVDSVTSIWPAANWYEREAFDLYGIQFKGHPDQRRLLTDYDFEGHPFRKDFPLIGTKEVRYDAKTEKVIYEPVNSVVPRTVIPKVTRKTHDDKAHFTED